MTMQDTEDAVEMEWLVQDSERVQAGMSLARMTLLPGCMSEAHSHRTCNEAVYVISGEIEQYVDGEKTVLREGEHAFIPKGALHQSLNVGAGPAVMLVAYSSGSRDYERAGATEATDQELQAL